jgi:hypothetical protein
MFGVRRFGRFWKKRFQEGMAVREHREISPYIQFESRRVLKALRRESPREIADPAGSVDPAETRPAIRYAMTEAIVQVLLISWISWIAISAASRYSGGMRWVYFSYAAVIIPLAVAIIISRVRAIIGFSHVNRSHKP